MLAAELIRSHTVGNGTDRVPETSGLAMGRSIDGLTPEERLSHYRLLAEDALESARTAVSADVRVDFLTMANNWRVLATQMERLIRKNPDNPQDA